MGKYILSAFADEYCDSFEEQLKALKSFGIDYIEPRFLDKINISELSPAEVKNTQKLLCEYGIGISALGSPLGKIPLDGDISAHFEMAKRTFETANILGASRVRVFSFYSPEGRNIKDCRDGAFEALEKLISLAEAHNILLCHENEAKIYGESPESCLKIMTHFSGRIKSVFDMGNFTLEGYPPYPEAFDMLKDHIEYFHIKDALSEGAIVPPGNGEGKIFEILKAFSKHKQSDTFITLEPHLQTFSGLNVLTDRSFKNPFVYSDSKAAFSDAVEKIKSILDNLN